MKIEFDVDESWAMFSQVVNAIIDEAKDLPSEDRAAIRRWKSEKMRPTDEAMRTLARKMNEDIAHAQDSKRRSHISRPDWR